MALFGRLSKDADALMKMRSTGQVSDVMNPADKMRMSEALGAGGVEGMTLNLTQADRSRVFGPNKGGIGFSGLQLISPPHAKANAVWGVGKPSHVTRMINQNTPETVWTTFVGSPTQHMSNLVTVQRMLEEFAKGKPSPELIAKINARLPEGMDIRDPRILDMFNTFDQRKELANLLTMGGPLKGEQATKNAFRVIDEEIEPLVRDVPTYAAGPRFFSLDNGRMTRPDLNSAFPEIVTGTDFGLHFEPAPLEVLSPELVAKYAKRLDKNGKLMPINHKDLTANTPKIFIDEERLSRMQKEGYADGGPIHMQAGGALKSMAAIAKAAEKAGQKAPVLANRSLTTLEDTHTSLGDAVRMRAADTQNMIESMPFKYDEGHHVFTEDSARKNWPPMKVLGRTLTGNNPMREDHPTLGPNMGKPIKDPETGKTMRSPRVQGYKVRMERGPDDWSEFVIPESAIKGMVEKASGGAIHMAEGGGRLGLLNAMIKLKSEADAAYKARKAAPTLVKSDRVEAMREILPADVAAANKAAFMAKSKDPRRFYHGTKGDITRFDPRTAKTVFVTPEPKFADDFAFEGQMESGRLAPEQINKANVMPLRVQVENPFDPENRAHMQALEDEVLKRFGSHGQQVHSHLHALRDPDNSPNNWSYIEHPDIQKALKSMGHDAYYSTEGGVKNLGVYDPRRVKSDIGNTGAYDIGDADISKKDGGWIYG